MFHNLLSKLSVVAVTAVIGLGAVTAPVHAFSKTLSGQLENGMTFSGSFEGEDKSGGGAIGLNELTAFSMSVFSKGKAVTSLGLGDLSHFGYSEMGALNGDKVFGVYNFFDGFFFRANNNKFLVMDYGFGTEKEFEYKEANFQPLDGNYISTKVLTSESSNLQSVPEPASMLGLLAVGAAGISTLNRKKKQQA